MIMKERKITMQEKLAFILIGAMILAAGSLTAAPKTLSSAETAIRQRIMGTLQSRVDLLSRLVADYEQQYKNGSLGWQAILKAKTALYKAELLRMKAQSGLIPEPGIAIALIDLYAVYAYAADLQKRFPRGGLSLSILLNAQLQANEAELKYFTLLGKCRNPGFMEDVRKKLPPFDPAKRLENRLLKEIFEAEIKAGKK